MIPNGNEPSWSDLEVRLGHHFQDRELLRLALTHRSNLPQRAGEGEEQETGHYERLEFLGDAVLTLVISKHLFYRFPLAPEGVLSQWRARLVNAGALANIGHVLNLGSCLRLGRGEEMSGGRTKESILADAVEALLGAIYLDAGEAVVNAVVLNLFGHELTAIDPEQSGKDFKTVLQERLQAAGLPLPVYQVVATVGAAHARSFTVECQAQGVSSGTGIGRSKRLAEQEAARKVLNHYQEISQAG